MKTAEKSTRVCLSLAWSAGERGGGVMSSIVIGSEGGGMKKMASTSTVLVAGSNTMKAVLGSNWMSRECLCRKSGYWVSPLDMRAVFPTRMAF